MSIKENRRRLQERGHIIVSLRSYGVYVEYVGVILARLVTVVVAAHCRQPPLLFEKLLACTAASTPVIRR